MLVGFIHMAECMQPVYVLLLECQARSQTAAKEGCYNKLQLDPFKANFLLLYIWETGKHHEELMQTCPLWLHNFMLQICSRLSHYPPPFLNTKMCQPIL